ncbi:TonB-dependent receptor [Geofilum rubicundum]|uniref:TonB-dependent outer membrane receptor n=1 Tax=Geofilum rubicundum JCM 15548 TaxID=1236989 RepID=A0A0E9M199_9BACT|nr:TonB-dependent receptor [Geofilum rubicundum]GAO31343.1 TonB-dependent outer membrane receptor [Geofilum rubicundum JCM 15548]
MKSMIILSLILLIPGVLSAQSKVSGQVFEYQHNKKEPIIGANVYWAETSIGASTNEEGKFHLPWQDGPSKLVVSFVGYTPDTLLVSKPDQSLQINLLQDEQLDEVTVAARQAGTHISRLNPITSMEITSAELCKAACCSLAESFETNASVDVSYTDAATGAKQIQLLGLSGTYVQMLSENLPTSRGLGATYGLDFVPGPWMESIQVSKGSASVSNGYESLTGQINVEYKKPATSETLFVNGFTSSSGRFESNVNTGFDVGEKWKTALLAHASTDSRENDHNGDGFLDEPLTRRYIFMNRWESPITNHLTTQFGLKVLDEERTGGQATYNRSIDPMDQEAYGILIDSRNLEAFFKAGYTFPGDGDKSVAFISNYTFHDQASVYGHRFYDATQNYLAGNLILASHFGQPERHKYTTGLSYLYDDLREDLSGDLTNIMATDGSRTEHVTGAYFQYTYTLPDKLTVLTGLRGDYHNLYDFFITPRMHVRYTPNEHIVVRASAGKGYRTPNTLAENNAFLASSRHIFIDDQVDMEEGWNYGLNVTNYIHFGLRELTLNVEYYRTSFKNQLVIDLDQDAREVHFYNLTGASFSNVLQAEASMEVVRGLDIVAAWRLNDVQLTTNDVLQQKALQSKYRGLLNFSYATPLPRWQFDFTTQFSGPGRIPSTEGNPVALQRPADFSAFQIYNTQITRYFKNWDFYAGIENIGDFTQHAPIIDAENPFGEHFDSSLIWGPMKGRKFYFGFRFSIDRV